MPRRTLARLVFLAAPLAIAGCFGSSDLPSAPSAPAPGTVKEASTGKDAKIPTEVLKKMHKAAPKGNTGGPGGANAN